MPTIAHFHYHSRTKILDEAHVVVRAKAYSAVRVKNIGETAGLTNSSFFHHFATPKDLAPSAACFDHLRRCLELLFTCDRSTELAQPQPRIRTAEEV